MIRTFRFSICILLLVNVIWAKDTCDYEHCPKGKPGVLNVHLVSHTHDDVGWVKTLDQYYFGNHDEIARAGVQYILDTVIPELLADPNKRFIYVETAFFWKWWERQDEQMKSDVRTLVQSGRLEFINGGWTMNDEGATHYNAIIDQMTLGLSKLKSTFGKCGVPRVAWQIDPFGHSKEMANLFAKMGFDGVFFGRIDYNDKTQRQRTKQMEMIWNTNADGSPARASSSLFTGILPNNYSPPKGFCFDDLCADSPIIDDPNSPDYNVDQKVADFIAAAKSQSQEYLTNHLIMTMGEDFNYQNAKKWFVNLDKLIRFVNAKNEINIFYSTPSCYLYALNQANRTWPTKDDDFFPYASDPHAFWTGYFTSRPALKYYIRQSNAFLQIAKQLETLSRIQNPAIDAELEKLKDAVAVNTHHDAVTGTERQLVAFDYERMLSAGHTAGESLVNKALGELMPKSHATIPKQIFCPGLNVSDCTLPAGNVSVTIYNPLAHERSFLVRVPITNGLFYTVIGPNGESVDFETAPIPPYVLSIPGRTSNATSELTFRTELPALGFKTYFIITSTATRRMKRAKNESDFKARAASFNVIFDKQNGQMKGIQYPDGSIQQLNTTFEWYHSMKGDNRNFDRRASGAYIFRPNGTRAHGPKKPLSFSFHEGESLTQVRVQLTPWIAYTTTVLKTSNVIELDWVVGPIPVADGIGKEVILRVNSDINSNGSFFTDSNGRQLLKRIRNHRATWTYNNTEPVSGNYYPINSRIMVQDRADNRTLVVLNDRSQGGSSLRDGQVELMVHRRCLFDDAFGVGEALNESGIDHRGLIIRGQHHIFIASSTAEAAQKHRELGVELFMPPMVTFASIQDQETYASKFDTEYSGLNESLPAQIHLLTVEEWTNNSILIRLEHIFQADEHPTLSAPVRVDLRYLFKEIRINGMVETTLTANQLRRESHRLSWRSTAAMDETPLTDFVVTLKPMEIRTFIVWAK